MSFHVKVSHSFYLGKFSIFQEQIIFVLERLTYVVLLGSRRRVPTLL